MKIFLNLILTSLFFVSALQAETPEEFYRVIETCRKNPERWPAIAYAVKIGRHDAAKFLIDRNEPIDADTPDTPVWYEGGTYFDSIYRADRNEPGYTALELAVLAQDVQMVKILLAHNPINRADPEKKHLRYVHLRPYGEGYLDEYYPPLQTRETSPLWHALSSHDSQIVELILKSYTNPERLFSELNPIKHKKNRSMMKSWIEKNIILWNGQAINAPDHMIDLFLNLTLLEAIELNQPAYIKQFLECGWIISKKEFELAIQKLDLQTLELLVAHDRFEQGFNPYDALIEKGLDDLATQYFSKKMLISCAKLNRADLLEKFFDLAEQEDLQTYLLTAIEYGSLDVIAFLIDRQFYVKGALLYAVKHKQKGAVELLIKAPVTVDEIEEARLLAYQTSAYDIFEFLSSLS